MKKWLSLAIIVLLFTSISCTEEKTFYSQFNKEKPFVSRVLDLNKTFDEIKKKEKGELINEDIFFLEYEYALSPNNTYLVSYLFDEKGCYEIGIDGFFEFEKDAINIVSGIQSDMNNSKYGQGTEDNYLNQWKSEDKSISIELDFKDTSRGLFLATIFANE